MALLTTTFSEGSERERALGVFGSVAGIGFGAGVILGGVLTSLLSWRWVFFINVPLGLLTLLGAFLLLPSSKAETEPPRLDLAGAFLGTGAMTALVLALSQMATPGGGVAQVLIPGCLSAVLAVVFIFVERQSQYPLVPLSVFRRRNLSVANVMALLVMAIASIFAFLLTLYLQGVLGLSPLVTGLAFLPAGLGGIVGGQVAIWGIRQAGLRRAAVLGPVLIVLGSVLLTRITPTSGTVWVVVGYLIAGIGIVCTVVVTTIAGTAQLEPALQGLAAGLINTSQQIGGAIGISLASVVATSIAQATGGSDKVAATAGDQAGLYLALGLAVIAGTLAILGLRTHAPVSLCVRTACEEQVV